MGNESYINNDTLRKKFLRKKKSVLKNKKRDVKAISVLVCQKLPKYFEYKAEDPRFKGCSIKNKYTQQNIVEAKTVVEETKKKNNKWFSFIFFIINIIAVAVVLIVNTSGQESASIGEIVKNVKWSFVGIAAGVFALAIFIEALKYTLLIYQSTKRFRPYLGFKTMLYGRYYDNITPGSSGGEPFQIYYLNKRGLKGEVATSVPLMRYVCWQIAYVITSLGFMLIGYLYLKNINPLVLTLAWIGISVNVVLLSTVLLLSISKKVGPRIVVGILKFLTMLKIVKDYQSVFRKTMRFVFNYQRCMKAFASNILYIIIQIILAVMELILVAVIPYFVYRAFVTNPPYESIIIVMSMISLCNLAVCFIPIPGGTGATEISFIAVYGTLFANNGIASWAILVCRFFSYYVILIMGILLVMYDFLIGDKKAEVYKRTHLFKDGFVFKDKFKRHKKVVVAPSVNAEIIKQQEPLEITNLAENKIVIENEIKKDKEENITQKTVKNEKAGEKKSPKTTKSKSKVNKNN